MHGGRLRGKSRQGGGNVARLAAHPQPIWYRCADTKRWGVR
jgi:hypothetical protein